MSRYISLAIKVILLEVAGIIILLGQTVVLNNISWSEFEAILENLGESRGSRIACENGKLEIMTLLPEHGRCT